MSDDDGEVEVEELVEPLREDELIALPVFPLPRVVFYPGTMLPLHLFEPRYRDMMRDCLEHGPRAMIIALLAPGWEDDYEGRPPVREICGAGRIIDHAQRPDGRYDLILGGVHRVRVEELPEDGRTYRRAKAAIVEDRTPHPEVIQPMLQTLVQTASSVSTLIRRRHPQFGLGITPDTAPGRAVDRIADRMVADVELRQRILEQADVKVRIALVQDAVMELLAQLTAKDSEGGSFAN